jgi:hypothetical protein
LWESGISWCINVDSWGTSYLSQRYSIVFHFTLDEYENALVHMYDLLL